MTTTAATLTAERWLDEVIIRCGAPADTLGADFAEEFSLPPGLGDVAIMNVICIGSTIDSEPAANVFPAGVEARIVSSDGTSTVDVVGAAQWFQTAVTATAIRMTAYLDPDALVLWRQSELLSFRAPELDDDATPTGDFVAIVKAVRVRPIEGAIGPIRLVR